MSIASFDGAGLKHHEGVQRGLTQQNGNWLTSETAKMGDLFENFIWLNEPNSWSVNGTSLEFTTAKSSDFWRHTHYHFVHDNGHMYGVKLCGGFTIQVRIRSNLADLYDQVGLMVRVDEAHWVKFGLEYSDGHCCLSVVVTNENSDWSMSEFHADTSDLWLRLTVAEGVVRAQVSTDGHTWPLVRLAPFTISTVYWVGPMACSPTGTGLAVQFSELLLAPPSGKDLHDLT